MENVRAATPVKLAVFDYDGTIINGQSGYLFARYLLKYHLIGARTVASCFWWAFRYKLHLPHEQDTVRRVLFEQLQYLPAEDVIAMMREFHDAVLIPRYRQDALAEVKRRTQEGCVCVLVSATFYTIAVRAAEYAGIPYALATKMVRTPGDHFDGRVQGIVIEGDEKPRAVATWANETFGKGNWVVEYAYGDHHTDELMLAKAVTPFAVDPGPTLARIAKERGWAQLEWK